MNPYSLLDTGDDPTRYTGPRGPLLDPSAVGPQPGPAAPPSRPSFLSRVAHYTPFRMNPTMASSLSPDQQNYIESEGQRQLAAGLLQAGGPAPQGTQNFGSRLGAAMSGVDWEGLQERMTNSAMQINQYRIQMQRIQQRQNIVNMFPPQPNETAQQTAMRYAQMLPYFIANGDTEIIGQMGEVIKSLGFDPSLFQLETVSDGHGGVRYVPINKLNGAQGGPQAPQPSGPAGSTGGAPGAPTAPPSQPGATPAPAGGAPLTGNPNPGGLPGVQPGSYQTPATVQQSTTNETNYRKEYQGNIKDHQTRADLYKDALTRADAAKSGDGIAQAQLVSAAATAMQGGVQGGGRGEALLALIDRSKPLFQKVKALLGQTTGKAPLLTGDEVDEITELLRQKYNSNARQWSQIQQSYQRGAHRANVDPSAIFPLAPDTLPGGTPNRPNLPVTSNLRRLGIIK